MAVLNKDAIVITIDSGSPTENRELFIRAISAAIRWRGHLGLDKMNNDDGENLILLSELLDALLLE